LKSGSDSVASAIAVRDISGRSTLDEVIVGALRATGHLKLARRDKWGQGDGRSDACPGDVGSIAERRALSLIDCATQLQGEDGGASIWLGFDAYPDVEFARGVEGIARVIPCSAHT
jgi:hypothetical protein